jgi:hypothetical protein
MFRPNHTQYHKGNIDYVNAVSGLRPLRLAYYEACLDLEDDFFCPVITPDVLLVGGWGKRDRHERLWRQIERNRTRARWV